MAAALFTSTSGIQATHVPFEQFGQTLSSLISGDAHFIFYGYLALSPQINAGKLRMLAVSTDHRLPYAPQVPTMAEEGYKDFEVSSWFGLYAPARTPKAIVDRLSTTVQRVLNDPALVSRLQKTGNDIRSSTPEELAAFTRTQRDRYRKIMAIIGMKAE